MDPSESKSNLESINNEVLDRPMGISTAIISDKKRARNPCNDVICSGGFCMVIRNEAQCICPTGIPNSEGYISYSVRNAKKNITN